MIKKGILMLVLVMLVIIVPVSAVTIIFDKDFDIDNYYTKTEVTNLLNSYYNTTEIDILLSNLDYYNTSQIDVMLEDFYNKSQIDNLLSNIDLTDYYNKTEVDDIINNLDYYTTSQVNNLFYNKTQVDTLLSEMDVDVNMTVINENFYNKTEIDNFLLNYYNITQIDGLLSSIEVNLTDYYNKTEINDFLFLEEEYLLVVGADTPSDLNGKYYLDRYNNVYDFGLGEFIDSPIFVHENELFKIQYDFDRWYVMEGNVYELQSGTLKFASNTSYTNTEIPTSMGPSPFGGNPGTGNLTLTEEIELLSKFYKNEDYDLDMLYLDSVYITGISSDTDMNGLYYKVNDTLYYHNSSMSDTFPYRIRYITSPVTGWVLMNGQDLGEHSRYINNELNGTYEPCSTQSGFCFNPYTGNPESELTLSPLSYNRLFINEKFKGLDDIYISGTSEFNNLFIGDTSQTLNGTNNVVLGPGTSVNGNNNVIIGDTAGSSGSLGVGIVDNTFIGNRAGWSSNNVSNNIAIGNWAGVGLMHTSNKFLIQSGIGNPEVLTVDLVTGNTEIYGNLTVSESVVFENNSTIFTNTTSLCLVSPDGTNEVCVHNS